jgi:hypothetical protein
MKKILRNTLALILLISAVVFAWQCSQDSPTTTENGFQLTTKHTGDPAPDAVTSRVIISVMQRVTNDTVSLNDYVQIAAFGGCNCFPIPTNFHVQWDTFTTPQSGVRYIDGLGWVTGTTDFQYVYGVDWSCQYKSYYYYAHWESTGFSDWQNIGGTCASDSLKGSGSYSHTSSPVTLSYNQTYNIGYGTVYFYDGDNGD